MEKVRKPYFTSYFTVLIRSELDLKVETVGQTLQRKWNTINDTIGLRGEKSFTPGICFSVGAETKRTISASLIPLVFHRENEL